MIPLYGTAMTRPGITDIATGEAPSGGDTPGRDYLNSSGGPDGDFDPSHPGIAGADEDITCETATE